MTEELRTRAKLLEREENEKSSFQRVMDRLADSADLPTRNPHAFRACIVLTLVVLYFIYSKTFARSKHQKNRTRFYHNLEEEREELFSIYEKYKDGLEVSVTAAAIIFLAASQKKTADDPVITPPPETHYHSIHPPASHFHVHAGV
ncbi:hypothetical protein STCU_02420 [Strigomonas culicis]|nr:hypothetical protein STCU_05888 [Strigomonas culicis]EPY33209.1 hypothetical protein STCU_02420 [Strigomonas culicis]|eukprot:EPY27164.1 hypothetical protein STCU_05888 [Strigomonas culicis]